MMGMKAATLPDKLAARETMLTAHIEGVRKLKAAVDPLYAALNPDPSVDEVGKATKACGSQAMPFGKGDIAIDAVPTANEVDRSLTKLESIARERGVAIGTASALPVSIDRIGVWIKGLEGRGIMLVPLTTAMLKSKSG